MPLSTLASIGIAAGRNAISMKPASPSISLEPCESPGPAAAHRQQIECEIGVSDWLGAAHAGYRLGNQQGSLGRQRLADGAQQVMTWASAMVVDNPHERDDIGAFGQTIGQEMPPIATARDDRPDGTKPFATPGRRPRANRTNTQRRCRSFARRPRR